MTVRVRDLSAIRPVNPAVSDLRAFSVAFQSVLQGAPLVPQAITVTGGTAPYSWAAVGLPAGVVIAAATGIISGTPTVSGDVTAAVTVTDADGNVATASAFFSILPAQFTDDFNRANNTNGFGDDWICAGLNYAEALGAFFPAGISVNQAVWQATAVNQNIAEPFGFMPVPPMSNLDGQDQFAQGTFVSSNSLNGTRLYTIGVSVLNGWTTVGGAGGFRQYNLFPVFDNINTRLLLSVFNGAAYVNLFDSGAGGVAQGDVLRLEARILGGGASVDLSIFRNGGLVTTINDASANRSIVGSPGLHRSIYVSVAVPGVSTVVWDDYSCGAV